jgi:hypothetical protein
MNVTIKTRDFGTLSFYCPADGGYVRIESRNRHGTLGKQICHGGGLMGSTISVANSENLRAVAYKWIRGLRRGFIIPDHGFDDYGIEAFRKEFGQ